MRIKNAKLARDASFMEPFRQPEHNGAKNHCAYSQDGHRKRYAAGAADYVPVRCRYQQRPLLITDTLAADSKGTGFLPVSKVLYPLFPWFLSPVSYISFPRSQHLFHQQKEEPPAALRLRGGSERLTISFLIIFVQSYLLFLWRASISWLISSSLSSVRGYL